MHIKRARTRQLFSLPFIVAHVDILSFNSKERAQLVRPKSASKHSQRKCVAPAAAVRGLVYLCGSVCKEDSLCGLSSRFDYVISRKALKKKIYVYVQTLATGAAETLIRGWGDLLPTSLNLSFVTL